MKVQYEIFDSDAYHSTCAAIDDLFPNDPFPDMEQFTERGTGEVIAFIKGGFFNPDMFLIADDESGEFMKIKVDDCSPIK